MPRSAPNSFTALCDSLRGQLQGYINDRAKTNLFSACGEALVIRRDQFTEDATPGLYVKGNYNTTIQLKASATKNSETTLARVISLYNLTVKIRALVDSPDNEATKLNKLKTLLEKKICHNREIGTGFFSKPASIVCLEACNRLVVQYEKKGLALDFPSRKSGGPNSRSETKTPTSVQTSRL